MNNSTLKSYIIGFALSVLLTLAAYFIVVNHLLDGYRLIAAIIGLALVQFMVQLIFFLHLGAESKPRWNLVVFVSTISVVLILVIGSIVIMHNLDRYHMMTPADAEKHLLEGEAIYR